MSLANLDSQNIEEQHAGRPSADQHAHEEQNSSSSLLGFIQSVAGESHVRVEENLGNGYVRLRSSEAERRQAKHDIRCVEDIIIELLRNSRDAQATSIFLATNKEGEERTITIIDNGRGIPEHMYEMVFEPRVTSKLDTMSMDRWGVHGRGMALFSIKSNSTSAKVLDSAENMGTAIQVKVDTELLSEIKDQSTAPDIERDENGDLVVVKGPRNINRKVAEFAIDTRHQVDVYLGSPAEIASTLIDYGDHEASPKDLLFNDDVSVLPICQRLASCGSATELLERCNKLGLRISERTAYRVMHGQIPGLKPYLSILTSKKSSSSQRVDIFKDSRVLKIDKDDIAAFSRKLESAFEELASQYYVSLAEEPKIKIGKDSIKVTFPIEKE